MIVGVLDIDYQAYIKYEHQIYNEVDFLARQKVIRCPICNSYVSMHGSYKRRVIFSEFEIETVTIVQVRCKGCKRVHAVIPGFIVPKKQYNSEIIKSAIKNEGLGICSADDSTIRRWRLFFQSNNISNGGQENESKQRILG